jgi:hypothetical protein
LQLTQVFPEGFGADQRPFEYGASPGSGSRAIFSVMKRSVCGLGIFNLTGQHLIREKHGTNIQERAEIWFTKKNPPTWC